MKSACQEDEIEFYINLFTQSVQLNFNKYTINFVHDSFITYLESKKLPYKAEYKKAFKKSYANVGTNDKSLTFDFKGERELLKELEFDTDLTIFTKPNEVKKLIENKIEPVINLHKFDKNILTKYKNFKKYSREMYMNYVNYKTLVYTSRGICLEDL